MQVSVATYAEFKALVSAIDDTIAVTYRDAEDRRYFDRFSPTQGSSTKAGDIDAQLKKYWEHRIDSN